MRRRAQRYRVRSAAARVVAALALAVFIGGCDQKQPAPQAAPAAPGDAAAGRLVAERGCKGCHGMDGRGTAPGIPHLAGQRERYLLESIKDYADGKRTHAALRDMTAQLGEAEVRNALAYYAGLPPAPVDAGRQSKVVSPYDRGKALAAGCVSCHGEDGNSTTPGTPTLAGQQPLYFVAALSEYHAGDRATPASRPMLRVGSKRDVESLALYFASQNPVRRAAPPTGDAAAGEPLTAVCGGCHGASGVSSDAATPSLAGQDPHYLTTAIAAYGKTRRHDTMDAQVAKLGDRDIRNIAAFYAAQAPRAAEKGRNLIQELTAKCERCHREGAEPALAPIPRIHGQDRDYLVMALRAYRDDRRESSTMHRMSLPFSDAVIESLAEFYATEPAR